MLIATEFGPITRFDLSRTLLGKGRYWTTAYLVDGLLVDSGCAHTAGELLLYIKGKPVDFIVNSHSHEDHIGANGLLQQQYKDIKIMAHPSALDVLAKPVEMQPLHPYRRLFWGWPLPSTGVKLSDGQSIQTEHHHFDVLFTPGHSPDHLCLHEANQGWLFTGDLFVGGKDRALRQGCDIWGIIRSLKHIQKIPITTLFPGSARLREHPADEIQTKIDYYERMGERVLSEYERGLSLAEIVHVLCGKPMWVELVTLGHFSRRHLVESYLHNRPAS